MAKKTGKMSKKRQEEAEKKLTPEERKAIKKQKKQAAYQQEKAKRKEERYQSSGKKFYNHHKVFTIVSGIILVAVICVGMAYWLNTGFFRSDSYKFISYKKYVTLGSYSKQTYQKSDLKVTDKAVQSEIDNRLTNASKKKLSKAFIKKDTNNECSTEKAYRKYIREILETEKKESVGSTLLSEVSEKSKVKKYPSKQYKVAKSSIESRYETMASQYGTDLAGLKSAMGMDDKAYKSAVKSAAQSSVKTSLVTHAIAKKAGIHLSSSEYKSRLETYKKEIGMTEKKFKAATGYSYEDYAEKNNMDEEFLQNMVGEFLIENATAK